MAEIETSLVGSVLTITLNRPEAYNAFTTSMHQALHGALDEARAADVRAVVITGAGKGFCAGQDMKEFESVDRDIAGHLEANYHPNVRTIRALEKPVIAAVNGAAAGAGLSLACACDIRIAADNAAFVPGFIGIGLVPDSGGTFYIARLLGPSRKSSVFVAAAWSRASSASCSSSVARVARSRRCLVIPIATVGPAA